MEIKLKTKILNDKYTEYVYKAFDIQNREETSVSIPMNLGEAKNFDWNIEGKQITYNHLKQTQWKTKTEQNKR